MRCLLIEDDVDTANLILEALRQTDLSLEHCPQFSSGNSLLANQVWDVVVLDRLLPGNNDGLDLLAAMRERGDLTPVLVLSALSSLDDRVRGLRAGGDDYLTKPFAVDELLARLDALLRRNSHRIERENLVAADLVLDTRSRKAYRGETHILLQPREFRLLEFLMRNKGKVLTRRMLLESVWDYLFDPQTNVVDVHISRLRQKIDKDFSPQLIHTVRGVGFVLRVTGSDGDG